MLCLLVALAISINVAYRPVVHRVDVLELNHFGTGTTQLVAWEERPGVDWPADWVVNPEGSLSNCYWFDSNGKIIQFKEFRESWTSFDPERRAYYYWQERGEKRIQCGFWKAP